MNILGNYKAKVKKLKNSRNLLCHLFYSINRLCYYGIRILIERSYRGQLFSRTIFIKHFHQISHYTEINRYPELFQICKDCLKDNPNPKILSFGCSTGEEVFSLGLYMPYATIVGVDISLWCIKECNKNLKSKRFLFTHSLSGKFKLQKDFDAVFCLAVFQRPENRYDKNIEYSSKYLFEKFEKQVIILHKKLKPGGIIVIDNCDFNFLETKIASDYIPLEVPNNQLDQERPLYNKWNLKVSDTSNIYRIFIKSKS